MIPGGAYTAIQHPDGTWDVLDVPIMGTGEVATYGASGKRSGSFDFDRAWLSRAIEVASLRRSEGFLARCFIDHHDGDGSRCDAGYLMPTRIGTVRMDGEDADALFADLMHVPGEVYTRIRSGRLPYRSMESYDPAGGFVSGLALLATEPPRWRLPMLTIGNEVACESPMVSAETEARIEVDARVVACARSDQAGGAWMRGRLMSKRATAPKTGAAKAAEEERREDDKPEPKTDDSPPKDDAKPDEAKGEDVGDEVPSTVDAAMSAVRNFKGTPEETKRLVEELLAFLRELSPGTQTEEGPPEQPAAPAHAKEPNVVKPNAEAIQAQARADLAESRLAAVEGKLSAIEAERALDAEVVKAAQDLSGKAGLGGDPIGFLRAKAKALGTEGFRIYVEAVKAHATDSPGEESGEVSSAALPDLPEDVAGIADPELQGVAIKAAQEWDRRNADGWPQVGRDLHIRTKVKKAKSAAKSARGS